MSKCLGNKLSSIDAHPEESSLYFIIQLNFDLVSIFSTIIFRRAIMATAQHLNLSNVIVVAHSVLQNLLTQTKNTKRFVNFPEQSVHRRFRIS